MARKTRKDARTAQHYFASTYVAWATADTREAAIKDAVRRTREAVRGRGFIPWPLEILSCAVPLPQSSGYEIDNYLPVRETGRHDVQKHVQASQRATPARVDA